MLTFWFSSDLSTMHAAIWLYFTSEVEPWVIELLRRRLAEFLRCQVQLGEQIGLQEDEFIPARSQYRASLVLRRLRKLVPEGAFLLAVTGSDLFEEGLNFVFGEADALHRCAVISLKRLQLVVPGRPLTRSLFTHRVLTEAVHEIGHLAGLGHCPEPTCVMHFSNSLVDTDRKGPAFCKDCRRLFHES
jgi:archaemetzincin